MNKGTKSKIARDHHYVPQFYLSGFTDNGKKDGSIYAHDLNQLKSWKSKVSGVGFQKDFYKVEVPGLSPDEVEKIFWHIEGPASKVLKKLTADKVIPTGKDYGVLMQFIALTVVRIPTVRESIAKSNDEQFRQVLSLTASLPDEQLRAHLERLRKENPDLPEVNIEAFRELAKSGEYTIDQPQNFHIEMLLSGLLSNLEFLATLLVVERRRACCRRDVSRLVRGGYGGENSSGKGEDCAQR